MKTKQTRIEGNYSILLTLVQKKKKKTQIKLYNCHKESISEQNVLQYATMIKSHVIWRTSGTKRKRK